ncbi:lithostathine-1-beta-like [Diadema antillarum]|uniref:lithostathine-1-beta-like n=1 Tax=Diadema antillarum TaxID=105358 RepID=UPI003A8C44C2
MEEPAQKRWKHSPASAQDHLPDTDVKLSAFLLGFLFVLYVNYPDIICPGDVSSPDSCYLHRQEQQPWEVARDTCDDLGGYLAAIETQTELSNITREVLEPHYVNTSIPWIWIGLKDRSTDRVYTWERVGGTLPESSSMWDSNEPNYNGQGGPNCGKFNGFKLRDDQCSKEFSYICEFGL